MIKALYYYFFRGDNLEIRDDAYYSREEVKCSLVAYGNCNKTMVTFLKDKWCSETYDKYLLEFKANKGIHKIVKLKNGIEEILLER